MMPFQTNKHAGLSEFSAQRASELIKTIAKKPHYVGTQNHREVADFLVDELKKLGLQPQTQEGTTLTEWGNLVKSRNIIAKISGTEPSKALLLLSHYDSAPHSASKGASDDASGVATILEGLRAYLHQNKSHKNDIIVLFSDAEELGLNGAALFVTKHRWAREVGLAINFEARGTSGPSYMLMEVNRGNAQLVESFKQANPKFPVSNSLMYSIYKMLPNDTDLTVFREKGNIQGFNFAFIDSHFNYHTKQDSYSNVSLTTIEHQGSYIMPLLDYFSNANLKNLDSEEDFVYFNVPFFFVTYPFSWIMNMAIAASIFFILIVFIGLGKKILIGKQVLNGFFNLLGSLITAGLLSYFGWKLITIIYPQYDDILQGFTYNGHFYIGAFSALAVAVAFLFYANSNSVTSNLNQTVAPLFIWILINLAIAFYLPGAGFFIIPVWFGLLMFTYFILTQKTNIFINLIFSLPALFIFVPFIIQLPIGLGLKMLVGSTALIILTFAILLPVFASFSDKKIWAGFFFIITLILLVIAHFFSGYDKQHNKPNSLLYVYDADKNQAKWLTYDKNLDDWTSKYLSNSTKKNTIDAVDEIFSKYNSSITYTSQAPIAEIAKPTITFLRDSVFGEFRYLKILISPNRHVNRYDVLANENLKIFHLKANGVQSIDQKGDLYHRTSKRVLSYYVVKQEPLVLDFCIPKSTSLDMEILESSFDLLDNPSIKVLPRENWMMPMPFVLTDAVVIQQKIKPTAISPVRKFVPYPSAEILRDSVSQTIDTVTAE